MAQWFQGIVDHYNPFLILGVIFAVCVAIATVNWFFTRKH